MQYTFVVTETRIYDTMYTVEADSYNEALVKASIGDTIIESGAELQSISNREVARNV